MKIRFVMLAVGMAAIAAVVLSACSNKSSTQPPTALATTTSTPAATATDTPAPTPSASPTPDASTDELLYRLTIVSESQKISDSLGQFTTLTGAPDIQSTSWRQNIEAQVDVWRSVYTEAQALEPPPKFRPFQIAYVAALSTLNDSANHLSAGIDSLDIGLIDKAKGEIATFTAQVKTAQQLIPED